MNSLKKLLLISVALGSFMILAYNLVWSPDWQVQRWPETRLRALYVQAVFAASIDLSDGKNHQLLIDAIQAREPEIEEIVFRRLLVSLGIAITITAGLSLLPGLLGRGKEGRLRGAELASVEDLKRLLFWRQHRRQMAFAAVYVALGVGLGAMFFKSLPAATLLGFFGLAAFMLAEFLSAGQLKKPTGIRIGGVEIPIEMEGRHTVVFGTTGAGKSMIIYSAILDARNRGDRGFVIDIGGACWRRFARKGDVLLAPGDEQSVKWNPFAEIRNRFDFLELARAAIPDGTGEAAGFHDMARMLLAVVMEKMHAEGNWSVSRLLYLICSSKREEMNAVVLGSPADVYTQDGAERLLQSVRAVLTTYLVAWSFIEDGGDFSIRDWIRNAPPGTWLFAKYSDGNATVMKDLLTSWFTLSVKETISDDQNIPPPTWTIADEFDSMGEASAARPALTKLRRYNGRCLLGVQTVAQLWDTYERDAAQVLLSCLSNQIYLRAGDPETAEYCSKALGEQEFLRQEQSRSRQGLLGLGGDPSKSEAERHALERIVLPSEMMTLADRVGYLKLAGDLPIVKIKVPIPSTEKRS